MKMRAGFVSNSSSSSFVFILPKNLDISSVEALHDYLYGPEGTSFSMERWDDEEPEQSVDEIWDTELRSAFAAVRAKSEDESQAVPALEEALTAPSADELPARRLRTISLSSRQAAEAVWARLRGQSPNEERTLFTWARLIEGGPDSDSLDRFIEGSIDHEAYEQARLRFVAESVDYACSRLEELVGPDSALYMVEFTDWGGDDLEMIMRNDPNNLGAAKRWELSIG
jgi:hypothetical protein